MNHAGIFIIIVSARFGTKRNIEPNISFSLGVLAAIGFFITQYSRQILKKITTKNKERKILLFISLLKKIKDKK